MVKGKKTKIDSQETQFISGDKLATDLVNAGLQNKRIDLRLWTCWGGVSFGGAARIPTLSPGTQMPSEFDGDLRSFACRVASALGSKGLTLVKIIGYTRLVSIAPDLLKTTGGHKRLATDSSGGFIPTDGHKVEFECRPQ